MKGINKTAQVKAAKADERTNELIPSMGSRNY